jgi:glycosyltransferase involved in cell wall biosynthesis
MRVLHLSADFPDPIAEGKTRAVVNLLRITPELSHIVYSLNRTSRARQIEARSFGAGWRAVSYGALPKGLWHRKSLHRVADWVSEDVRRRGSKVDLVHAHKLSVEGLAGEVVARRLGVPLVTSVQGNSDEKIIRFKPDLRRDFRRIWQNAATAFPFAPWVDQRLNKVLGARGGPTVMLPCPSAADRIIAPEPIGPVIRSAFALSDHANKNASGLFAGLALAAEKVPELKLEIAGGGTPSEVRAVRRLAARAGVADRVQLVGPLPHHAIQDFLHRAAAFALVSHRESYGMVYAEALLAGTPILHSVDSGFAGYLTDGAFSLSAPPDDPVRIAQCLVRLIHGERPFKARLRNAQRCGALDRFQRPEIAAAYVSALNNAVEAARC